MCGVAALFSFSDARPAEVELGRMMAAMVTRGPDGEGRWCAAEGRVQLGHRRLAILDLSPSGAQPMVTVDGRIAIAFNGEIYNFRELRLELEQRGVRFRSHSDTEVILEGYRLLGPEILGKLRGMFALVLWDGERGGLLAARDGLGIKPLYVADDGGTLRIASQVKALLAGGGIDTEPDPAGHAGFFLWGHVPEPHTLYRSIRALTPGTWKWWGLNGERDSGTFFDLGIELRRKRKAPHVTLADALDDSVSHHLIADVPVGVFLSAGRDSATLAALASARAGGRVKTVTLAFDEFAGTPKDEAPLAEQVAAHYGTEHATLRIPGSDFAVSRARILADMDQPTIDGINVWFVARAARAAGLKVALSGLGGDELFAGYDNFRTIPRMVSALRPLAAVSGLGRGFCAIAAPFVRAKLAGLIELGGSLSDAYLLRRGLFMPWELPQVMDPDMARAGLTQLEPRLRLSQAAAGIPDAELAVGALEMQFYMRNQLLRDADWAGMAHSIEIRVPLVDTHLLAAVLDLRSAGRAPRKEDMAACALPALPPSILERPKTGFFMPVAQWLGENSLNGWARRVHSTFVTI